MPKLRKARRGKARHDARQGEGKQVPSQDKQGKACGEAWHSICRGKASQMPRQGKARRGNASAEARQVEAIQVPMQSRNRVKENRGKVIDEAM